MNKKSRIFGLFLISFVFILPVFALAQQTDSSTGNPTQTVSGTGAGTSNVSYNITIDNPFKAKTIPDLVKDIVNDILIPIGAVVAVVMIIYSGFLFVTAGGNDAQITKAKESLMWAVIGSAILLAAWVISEAVQGTINQLKS